MTGPVFVLGTQRSGTTLMLQILNSLSGLYIVNEFYELFDRIGDPPGPAVADLVIERLELEGTDADEVRKTTGTPLDIAATGFVHKTIHQRKRRWGLKDPRISYFLDPLFEHFPQARFVCLVRDPRAVVASNMEQRLSAANAYVAARLWREEVTRQLEFAEAHPDAILLVPYEQLIADFEREIGRVCEFIGEALEPNVLRYHELEPTTPIHPGNANILRPPDIEISQRRRSELGARQTALVESVTGEVATVVGYDSTTERRDPPRWLRTLYETHQTVMTTWWYQRRTSWSGVRRRLGLPYDPRPRTRQWS